jgi:hypothetical protein
MIFYSDVAKDFAEDVYSRLTTMVVYKGTRPTVQSYISKVNDDTYKWSGNYLLQAYKDVDLKVNKIESTYRISKNSPDGTEYGDYIRQSGNAEWAVLFDLSMLEGTNKLLEFDPSTNRLNFLRNLTENDLFMIVPVSDASGAGVLRFDTITFDNSNKVIKKFTLNFS